MTSETTPTKCYPECPDYPRYCDSPNCYGTARRRKEAKQKKVDEFEAQIEKLNAAGVKARMFSLNQWELTMADGRIYLYYPPSRKLVNKATRAHTFSLPRNIMYKINFVLK